MNTLKLIIKQKFFDQILSGDKKEETREIRPKTASRYCEFDAEGVLLGAKEYDALELFVGYQTDRPSVIVEVKSAEIILYEDEETHELLTFEENGIEYIESDIVYQLGTIISKNNC